MQTYAHFHKTEVKAIVFTIFALLLFTDTAIAQPGGPGGRRPPMGAPGSRPGGPSGDRNSRSWGNTANDKRADNVKQKKIGNTYKVVGSLRDSVNGEFAPYVNVGILNSSDSTFVKGASTNLDGYFEINDIPAGDYILRVSAIGYRNLFKAFTVTNNTALGTLLLKPGATTLQEVTISADRPLYAMDGEKMIYNVSEDPSIQTGTTNDALQNAPGVEVDVEGNISLRGVSSVEIWVNDKPSKLNSENLKTYLETLPANALARIETITNPSAKYATQADAVINIVTSAHIKSNQFISFGLNGSSQPFVSPWLSYMWAKEKLSVNVYASGRYSFNKSERTSKTVHRKDRPSFPGEYDTIQMDSTYNYSNSQSLGGNIYVNVNYEIDSANDIEFHGSINANRPWSDNHSYNLRDQSFIGAPNYTYFDTNDNPGSNTYFGMLGADYTKKFDNEGHNLRIYAGAHFSSSNDIENRIRNYQDITYSDLDYNKYYHDYGNSQSFSVDARYNRPLNSHRELSFGLGYSYDQSHNVWDIQIRDQVNTDLSVTDLLRSYTNDEQNHNINADANWTERIGKLTIEIGLGAYYKHLHYSINSDLLPDDDTSYNFITYTPSIHFSYRTESMHNFKLNYSLHMRNPSGNQLSTFRRYSEESYSTGNRDLTASITHNAEIGWTKFFERFGYLGIDGYAAISTNNIDQLTSSVDSDPYILGQSIQYTMPMNMGSSYRYGASANVTYRPSGFFNLRFYANAYESGYTIVYHGQERSDNMFSYSLRLNGWAKVFNKYQVHASINYSSPTQGLFSTQKERFFFNLGVRADFFDRHLSAFININDLFNWQGRHGSGNENTNPYLLSESTSRRLNARFISAGVTFRFGKMELENNAKTGGSEAE